MVDHHPLSAEHSVELNGFDDTLEVRIVGVQQGRTDRVVNGSTSVNGVVVGGPMIDDFECVSRMFGTG